MVRTPDTPGRGAGQFLARQMPNTPHHSPIESSLLAAPCHFGVMVAGKPIVTIRRELSSHCILYCNMWVSSYMHIKQHFKVLTLPNGWVTAES